MTFIPKSTLAALRINFPNWMALVFDRMPMIRRADGADVTMTADLRRKILSLS